MQTFHKWLLDECHGEKLSTVHIIDGKSSVNRTEDVEVYLSIEAGDKERLLRELQKPVISFTHYQSSMTPLQLAVYLGHHELIAPLIAHGCNMKGATLCLSESEKSLLCLQELMKYKIDLDERDDMQRTLLYMTIADNPEKFDLIEKLLDIGYDINSEDYTGRNILHRLALKDFSSQPYLRIAELLLDRGINIKAKDPYGQYPVESAASSTNLALLRLLLRRGGEMDSIGWPTVAHRSFNCERYESLKVIIKFCIVRELQGKAVDNRVKTFIKSAQVSEYYKLCLEEVNALKEQQIFNTKVSFYDLLFAPVKIVAKYMKNRHVLLGTERNAIESSEFLYDIEEAREKALIRRDLEDSSSQMILYNFKLPELCSERINRHLENQDLENFIRSWNL